MTLDYEFGWGSDFDEDDEDDEVQSAEVQQANNTTCDSKVCPFWSVCKQLTPVFALSTTAESTHSFGAVT